MYKCPILEKKRLAAIEWLGTRWILHSQYVYNAKHTPGLR